MKLMGSKIASRAAVQKAGVPIVPGTTRPLQSREDALKVASEIGYPVMLKASAGGGGKGLRLVSSEEELTSLYETASSEALTPVRGRGHSPWLWVSVRERTFCSSL